MPIPKNISPDSISILKLAVLENSCAGATVAMSIRRSFKYRNIYQIPASMRYTTRYIFKPTGNDSWLMPPAIMAAKTTARIRQEVKDWRNFLSILVFAVSEADTFILMSVVAFARICSSVDILFLSSSSSILYLFREFIFNAMNFYCNGIAFKSERIGNFFIRIFVEP